MNLRPLRRRMTATPRDFGRVAAKTLTQRYALGRVTY
jgi:hypothetical protein